MENLNEALSLLVIGMVMVLTILFLVVVVGNVVIQFTNRYVPATQKSVNGRETTNRTNPMKLAAITAVVDTITQGKGIIESIQKK